MDYLLPLAEFQRRVALSPDKPYLHQPVNRQWQTFTRAEVEQQARRIAAGLKAQGFEPGSRIAIFSKNCAQWLIADIAIAMAGMVSVPIYATAGTETIEHVLSHSEAKAVFMGKLDGLDAAQQAVTNVLRIAFPYPTIDCDDTWQAWLERYSPIEDLPEAQPDDLFSIVYTSGSTGTPKGVALSHLNIASASYCSAHILDVRGDDRTMSYLPLAHITERTVVAGSSIYSPLALFFVESLETFIEDIQHAQPTHFISVPRLWTKFQANILQKLPQNKLDLLLKIPLISGLICSKIRKGMGLNQCRVWGSGSAPISTGILDWFEKIGMPVSEGWGMTETSGLSCVNLPYVSHAKGTIGKPVSCVNLKLSEQGEILISGDAVFSSYYKNPEITAEVFTDGWFHTGDRGQLTAEGNYRIIGRVKDQFKTSKGKYVDPVPLESLLASNPSIDQVCIMGAGRKQPIAVVVLNEQAVDDPGIMAQLEKLLSRVNSQLESHQVIDHIVITDEVWSIDNGLLTATLKIKRRELEQKFSYLLKANITDAVAWERNLAIN